VKVIKNTLRRPRRPSEAPEKRPEAGGGFDATTPKEALQLSIGETFIKLEKAQEEEATARQELEKFLGQAKKESTPSIWIR
jgi:hypothetical protein